MQTKSPDQGVPTNFGPEPQFWKVLKFIPILLIGIGVWAVANYVFGDQWETTSIRGAYQTSSYIPEGKNAGKSFLVTDDTFYYVSEVSSPGHRSVGTNSFFNRVYYYLYDQNTKKVEKRVKLSFDAMPPDIESYFVNGKIWVIGAGGSSKANDVWVINPDTLEIEKTLSDLEKEIPEFKVGVLSLSRPYNREQILNFSVELLDGSNVQFFPGYMKAFNFYNDFLDWLIKNNTKEMITDLNAVYLTSDNPKKLVWTSAPKESLATKSYADNTTFVEGRILFQDGEYALIIHQKTAQDLSPRLLSLVEIDKGVKWTLDEADMPAIMRVNPNDTFTQLFFIDGKMTANRAGNLIFFKLLKVGVLAIDIDTGKVSWWLGRGNL